jgi:hypothetical protein
MDPKAFFENVVLKNYDAYRADPTCFSKLWNAVVSANSVADYVALHRLGYGTLLRKRIDAESERVRQEYPELQSIRERADTLKHVRRHVGQGLTETSTGILARDPTTWHLDDGSTLHSLRDVLDRAVAVLPTIPEIK